MSNFSIPFSYWHFSIFLLSIFSATPALGKTNGVITPFKAGAVVKRQATQPFVALGTSNPSIASSDLNEVDDSDASTESADGSSISFYFLLS